MKKYSCSLEDDLFDMVHKLALDSGLSMGDIINGILRVYYLGINDPQLLSERLNIDVDNL